MLRTVKPKNARSKRAMDARMPQEVEEPRTAIFVRGSHIGEVLKPAMKDLMALKRPYAVSFNKQNLIHPFDANTSSQASLEFWSNKNDASMFIVGQTTKKRPNGLTLVRMYDGKILDMLELGVQKYETMDSFKTPKSTPGHKPLMHFASELFDTHPRVIQLKSMLLDLFNGEEIDSICLKGLDHVISVTCAPTPQSLNNASTEPDSISALPMVHIRSYTTQFLASGSRIPRVELTPMGPSFDMVIRRHQDPDPELWKHATKKPKLKKQDLEKGLGKKKKNLEVDEMGDLRGKVHIAKQDLGKLQQRKMKGLKRGRDEDEVEDDSRMEDQSPKRKQKV